jgi:hypothetical protein
MLGRLCDVRFPRALNRRTMVDDDDEFEAIAVANSTGAFAPLLAE